MARTSQILSSNAQLLKARVSKYAVAGVIIAIMAIVAATAIMGYFETGAVTLDSMTLAQKSNASLWMLDAMPFFFAFWHKWPPYNLLI